jgi:hypothetical protein
MARSRSRSAGKGGDARASRSSKSKKPAAVAEVEVVEESAGLTIDDGIPMITTLLLVAAILVTDYVLGTHYGEGLFFK